jgi:hypothetical protein
MSVFGHLDTRINAAERVEQLQPVIEEAARCTGPQVIGGDLNTNDVYWLRNRLPVPGGASHGLAIRHAMEQHGFGTPFANALNTFPALRRHLDWIFVRDLRPLAVLNHVPFPITTQSGRCSVWCRIRTTRRPMGTMALIRVISKRTQDCSRQACCHKSSRPRSRSQTASEQAGRIRNYTQVIERAKSEDST